MGSHWRKFKRQIRDIVLYGESDVQTLSKEFTTVRQTLSEDLNQFYLRLLNLGVQSGRTVNIQEYRTRLVMPLQTLINQQDHQYQEVQDIVNHARKLWKTLTPTKIRREIKEFKEDRQKERASPNNSQDQKQPCDRQQNQNGRLGNQAPRNQRPQGY